ncbi:MAG TPA: glycosyltransferase family 4 protein [Myxococcota bacterium]
MRVGLFHNRYRERGGEDVAFDVEVDLLSKAGHQVEVFAVDNREEIGTSAAAALRAGLRARWNPETVRRVEAFLATRALDVAHVHNFFPVLSPSLHATLHARGVPVVQTLHNYRLLCANGLMLRAGRSCEDCVARGPWNAVRHACYRGSRLQTAVWSELTALHRRRGTWRDCVDLFTVPSAFARGKLLQADIPPQRLRVLPLPVADPGPPQTVARDGALFVGRLSPEKGVDLLLQAWRRMGGYPLHIVGTGPEEPRLRALARDLPGVHFAGGLAHDAVLRAMADTAFVVLPSRWHETFGLAAVEAMACGRGVVVPRATALADLVEPGRNGLLFEMGDVGDLARACAALAGDAALARELGAQARAHYEDHFTPERCIGRFEEVLASVSR